jgi:AAA ATPase-like protein
LVHTIVGRAHEVAVLDGFLADAHAQPSAVLIEGEPGIGKTTLLDALIARADERDHAVLACQPSRSEMDLSYVGLVGLLGQVPEHDINALPDPQARVLRMVLRREEPDAAFDRLSLGVALVAAVRALASIRTVLIAIDDVQFLDHPTARTLAFALRRLAGVGVRVALVRSGAGDAPAAIAELESLVATLPPGLLRARALYHLMYVTRLSGSLGRAVDHGVRAAEEAAGDPLIPGRGVRASVAHLRR